MPSPTYFRFQADVCLRLSLIASDEEVASRLLAMSRGYTAKADALEAKSPPLAPGTMSPPFPAAKRAHSKRSVGFSRARSGARGRLFLGVSPYGLLLNCWSARLAYFGWYVVPCPHSTPLPRLPGADEVRQGDPAAGSPAGAFRFPLCPLQSGGNHYAGSVCLDRPGGCSLPGVRGRLGEGKARSIGSGITFEIIGCTTLPVAQGMRMHSRRRTRALRRALIRV